MAAAASSSACLRTVVADSVWAFSTPFRFFGTININNNGMLVKVRKTTGTFCLVAVNAPQLNPGLLREIKEVESQHQCAVEWIVGTDWHHMFTQDWAREFTSAQVVFPAPRAFRLHEAESFAKSILDRERPLLAEVDPASLTLVPWIGFDGVHTHHPDESPRGEYSVHLPEHKLLFVFDIFVPLMPPWNPVSKWMWPHPVYRQNFGGLFTGFRPVNKLQCSESAKRLLALDLEVCVFSHGDLGFGAIVRGKSAIQQVFKPLEALVSANNNI